MGKPAIFSISAKVKWKLSVAFSRIQTHNVSYLLIESPLLWPVELEKLPDMPAYQFHDLRLPVRLPIAEVDPHGNGQA